MSKLVFTSDGRMLLHLFESIKSSWSAADSQTPSFGTSIDVWDIVNAKFLYSTLGYLIGPSDDGKTFLTQRGDKEFAVIEMASGKAFPLEKGLAAPEDYSTLHHRFYLGNIPPGDRYYLGNTSTGLGLCDIFGEYPN